MIDTQQKFLARLKELYDGNVAISSRKNSDYAAESDPFANFRVCEALGIPAEVGILVRITDKISRISNLIKPGAVAKVADESVLDTLADLANYAMILRMYMENKIEEASRPKL